MDTGKWTQETGVVKSMAEIAQNTCSRTVPERKIRPQKDQAVNCPRCNSTNTKFCYYNNYSLTQPRYFCKTCRRYWTEGGTLRNVPVGGGSRKNKKASSSVATITTSTTPLTENFRDLNPSSIHQFSSQNPKIHQLNHDLNLTFPSMQTFHDVPQMINNTSLSSSSTLELLKTGMESRDHMNSYISTPSVSDLNALYTSGFPFQEMKPSLNFSLEGLGNRYESSNGVQENIGKLMFPFGGLMKQQQHSTTTNEVEDHSKGQGNSGGYWNGMLGGGSW